MDLDLPGAREEECDSSFVGFGFWTAAAGVSWVSILTVVDGEKVRERSVDRAADERDENGDEEEEEGEEFDGDGAERDADERDRAGVADTSGLVGVDE